MGRILITHATRAGSTTDIAGILADALRDTGHEVVVANAKDNPSPDGYDLVVVGSGVGAGMWYSEAVGWARANADALRDRVALFNVCITAADPSKYEEAIAYNDAVAKLVDPLNQTSFAGRVAPKEVGFLKRLLLRWMRAPQQDHVNADAIRSWAAELESLVPAA